MWSDAGAYLDFNIAYAYYQTTWFAISCAAALLASLAGLYRLRLRQIERHFSVRLEERLAERTRIAQELHDTLLQGFLSASMQVHVAADCIPDESQAKPTLKRAQELMRQVIDEGRNALRGLRSHDDLSFDLKVAFSQVPLQFGSQTNGEEIGFRVAVEGQKRALHPLLRDEIYRIGREALINAFRHSWARHIQVEIKYFPSRLSVLVRDDGHGIDPKVLKEGRTGHWGVSGMRERAEKIGARLRLVSSPADGTEVELSVPAHIVFLGRSRRRWTKPWGQARADARRSVGDAAGDTASGGDHRAGQ